MNEKTILEQKEFNQITEKELLHYLYSLEKDEEIIINDKSVRKVINKDE